jgi:hypothetical protein
MGKGNNNSEEHTAIEIGLVPPPFLTVSNSPVYESGSIVLSYNNTPLPLSSGGTGLTAVGSPGQILTVLSNEPEQIGWTTVSGTGSVTSVDLEVPSFLSVSSDPISTSGVIHVEYSGEPLPISVGGTGQISLGQRDEILVSDGAQLVWEKKCTGTVEKVDITVPSFLKVISEPIVDKGILKIDFSGDALPVSLGGTGLTLPGLPNQILSTDGVSMTWKDECTGTVTSVQVSVPSFLSVLSEPLTSSGFIEIGLSGRALPVSSGGTGLNTVGAENQIISSDGEKMVWTDPKLGTVESVSVNTDQLGFIQTLSSPITHSGEIILGFTNEPLSVSHGGTGLDSLGQNGQVLGCDGQRLLWVDPPVAPEPIPFNLQAVAPLIVYGGNQIAIENISGSGALVCERNAFLYNCRLQNPCCDSITIGDVVLQTPLNSSYTLRLPSSLGSIGQVLSNGGNSLTWTTPTTGTVSSVSINSLSPLLTSNGRITSDGAIDIGLNESIVSVTESSIVVKKPLFTAHEKLSVQESTILTLTELTKDIVIKQDCELEFDITDFEGSCFKALIFNPLGKTIQITGVLDDRSSPTLHYQELILFKDDQEIIKIIK